MQFIAIQMTESRGKHYRIGLSQSWFKTQNIITIIL